MQRKLKVRELCFVPVDKEPWQKECYHATVRGLYIYNNNLAYYEVSRDKSSETYYGSFWYGNQGHGVSICGNAPLFRTREEAMEICQIHYELWLTENVKGVNS
jgi:hypothetical protein